MKGFFRFVFRAMMFAVIVGVIIYALKKVTEPPQSIPAAGGGVLPNEPIKSLDDAPLGGAISDDLLKILVCPEDKGPLELVDDGKFLLNPRNGYKYPIRSGIPVMLIEEGKKYRDAAAMQTNGVAQDKSAEKTA